MDTQYPRQSYLDLIQAQIDANAKDADELMVQRLYDVPDMSKLVLNMMRAAGQPKERAYLAMCIAYEIEKAVFAAIEKSEGEMAEIEAMQTPDPEDFDNQSELEKEWNAQADAAGVRHV